MSGNVQIGDTVHYVPHECHALEADARGEYPWRLGRDDVVLKPKAVEVDGKMVERLEHTHETEILSGHRIGEYLSYLKRAVPGEKRKLRRLEPLRTYPATVAAVHDDGSVDLVIKHPRSGVTLEYVRVHLDHKGANPHTCHKGQKSEVRGQKSELGKETLTRRVSEGSTPEVRGQRSEVTSHKAAST